jgi:hypothetical protein
MKIKNLILLTFVMILTVGCASQRVWSYKSEPHSMNVTPLINKKMAVLPLLDKRENTNSNMWAMYLIPGMPFGWQDFNTPEGAQMHMTSGIWLFKPTEDLSKAIAEDLNNSGIFQEAFFTYKASDADLVLRGELISTHYEGYMITYCLSVYGPLLWLLPVPSSYATNELEILLKIEDPTHNKVVWEKNFKKDAGDMGIGMYYMAPDFLYDKLLKEIMLEAIDSLKKNPPQV